MIRLPRLVGFDEVGIPELSRVYLFAQASHICVLCFDTVATASWVKLWVSPGLCLATLQANQATASEKWLEDFSISWFPIYSLKYQFKGNCLSCTGMPKKCRNKKNLQLPPLSSCEGKVWPQVVSHWDLVGSGSKNPLKLSAFPTKEKLLLVPRESKWSVWEIGW